MAETDIYPVGVLAGFRGSIIAIRYGQRDAVHRYWRRELDHIRRQAKAGNWRAVRNAFNGYLAEHPHHDHSAGRGWTKAAASRRALRICELTRG